MNSIKYISRVKHEHLRLFVYGSFNEQVPQCKYNDLFFIEITYLQVRYLYLLR